MWNSTLHMTQYHSNNIFLQKLVTIKTSNTHLGPFVTPTKNFKQDFKLRFFSFIEALTILLALKQSICGPSNLNNFSNII